ncbi:MAG: hypothetical protein IDH49_11000 [Gammaproteobacteria bacterium]|nr:hypothetical protein [Gammaproteobacteria bacterium]
MAIVFRHLRKLYPDPITRQHEWRLVKGPGDVIMVFFSLSEGRPMKRANFRGLDQGFAGESQIFGMEICVQADGWAGSGADSQIMHEGGCSLAYPNALLTTKLFIRNT